MTKKTFIPRGAILVISIIYFILTACPPGSVFDAGNPLVCEGNDWFITLNSQIEFFAEFVWQKVQLLHEAREDRQEFINCTMVHNYWFWSK